MCTHVCIPVTLYYPSHSPNQIPRNTSLFHWLYLQMINGHLITYITTTPWYVRLVITGGSPWIHYEFTRKRERKREYYTFSLKFSLASMAQTAREVRNTLRNYNKTTVWLEREPQSGSNTRRSRSHLRAGGKKRGKHISPIAWPGCSGCLRSSLRMHACTLRTRTRTWCFPSFHRCFFLPRPTEIYAVSLGVEIIETWFQAGSFAACHSPRRIINYYA